MGPLSCMKGVKPPLEIWRGHLGLLSRRGRNKRAHVTWMGNLLVFLKLQLEAWDSSPGMAGSSESLSCCLREVKFHLISEEERKIALEPHRESGLISQEGVNLKVFPEVVVGSLSSLELPHGELRDHLILSWEVRNPFL